MSYRIDQPLPPELYPSQGAGYLRYPIFGRPWYWRRAAVYGPICALIGGAIAIRAGRDTGDWSLAIQFAARTVPVWCLIPLVGPIMGVWVRERRFPLLRERRLLVATMLFAVALSLAGKAWYESFYSDEIRPVLIELGKGGRALPGMVLNSIETLPLSDRLFDWFYRVFFVFVIVSLSGAYPLAMYFREQRAMEKFRAASELARVRQERDEADSKLMVLQAQIEPHFLYNALASVRALIRNDVSRAEATIDALVDHLRATLPKLRDGELASASLGDQLEICRSYLEVMRVRSGGRLVFIIDADPDIAGLSFPPLMLLSLVENAVKHGVEPKPGPCSVEIRARRDQGMVEVVVKDDGAGLREGPSDGVGLANIRAQLATRYKDRASLELRGREGGGVIATLRIPIESDAT